MPLFRKILFGKKKPAGSNIPSQPGILRFFSTFFIVTLLLIGVVRFLFFSKESSADTGPRDEPLKVSKHSDVFNRSLQKVLDAYYKLTDAFINSDTSAISVSGMELRNALADFKVDELKKDSLIYLTTLDPLANAKTETESIIKDPSIDEKRGSLNVLTDNLQDLLATVKYDLQKIYLQQCSSAFGEERPGSWLSRSEKAENPYGKPGCAEMRLTLDYTAKDSTVKK